MPADRDLLMSFLFGDRSLKRAVQALLDLKLEGHALVLLYSGIDVMAHLGRPAGAEEVTSRDFERWCDQFMTFPRAAVRPSGSELYAARCAVLHTYGMQSRATRKGVRSLLYARGLRDGPLAFDEVPGALIVDVDEPVGAFFAGVDAFAPWLVATPERLDLTEERMRQVFIWYPFEETLRDAAALGLPGE